MPWAAHHFRAQAAAWYRTRRQIRKARGVCQRCGVRRITGQFTTCLDCRLAMQDYHRKMAKAAKA
jgi:hypothetical protein